MDALPETLSQLRLQIAVTRTSQRCLDLIVSWPNSVMCAVNFLTVSVSFLLMIVY